MFYTYDTLINKKINTFCSLSFLRCNGNLYILPFDWYPKYRGAYHWTAIPGNHGSFKYFLDRPICSHGIRIRDFSLLFSVSHRLLYNRQACAYDFRQKECSIVHNMLTYCIEISVGIYVLSHKIYNESCG